ncbi:MAG: LamG-like jellyroll fold domain-containing protein [Hyphomonadaceae bacterium]
MSATGAAPSPSAPPAVRLALEIPAIALLLGFTAASLELRWPGAEAFARLWAFDARDTLANVLGFLPLGMIFAPRGLKAAVLVGALVSLAAETAQLFSPRYASVADLAANTLGAALGAMAAKAFRLRLTHLVIGRVRAAIAAALALGFVALGAQVSPRDVERALDLALSAPAALGLIAVNQRGLSEPGRLEARWTFEGDGEAVTDASGNGLRGAAYNRPARASGPAGGAVVLNGVDQFIDVGDPVALQIVGSMTLSAWIRSEAFPEDDAAIISSRNRARFGYQLDTSVDAGPRAIALEMANSKGDLMGRYGATPLRIGQWYHVAGVYDAQARTLDVYLNGLLDNGCLDGEVTDRQHASGAGVVLGRRAAPDWAHFTGAIADARVYSRAVSAAEIGALAGRAEPAPVSAGAARPEAVCPFGGAPEIDPKIAGAFVMFGLLTAVAVLGFWRWRARGAAALIVGGLAGLAILPALHLVAPTPALVPLLTLLGAAAAVAAAWRGRQNGFAPAHGLH